MSGKIVKGNVYRGDEHPGWLGFGGGVVAVAAALAVVLLVDSSLPEPLTRASAGKDQFIAEIAYEHLVNLTSIGPRVAGSYENEVLAVRILVEALRRIAAEASPHNRVEIDVHKASGAFSLSFFDGMNNIYHDVQSVVARVSAAGGRPARGAAGGAVGDKTDILINCHYDTVPDSPGASDDGAGCAVALETFRVLAAGRAPLRHRVVLLLNGAEENIMQASHAFITAHPWAKSIRAFVNLEACGAGGREVLFQAGPHDPWIMEVYASVVPHPFASSVAQEMFQSGIIPGDTDYRIFRDFGNLSGVDLAWISNGYVYHTARDVPAAVPRGALQRTGDNVLALVRGMLSSPELLRPVDVTSRPGVFFDVVGVFTVSCGPRVAAAAVVALVVATVVAVEVSRPRHTYMPRAAWRRLVLRGAACAALGAACGTACAACCAWATRAGAVLCAAPALGCCWSVFARCLPAHRRAWRARALSVCGAWCVLACACAACGLASGFLPVLHAMSAPVAICVTMPIAKPYRERISKCVWFALSLAGCLQTCYLAQGSLAMLMPIAARAGTPAVPVEVVLGALTGALALAASCALLPLLPRNPRPLVYACFATFLLGLLVSPPSPFTPSTPRRVMLLHTRTTLHRGGEQSEGVYKYWAPQITPVDFSTLAEEVPSLSNYTMTSPAECSTHPYCGAPYFLPVLGFIHYGAWIPTAHPPLVELQAGLSVTRVNDTMQRIDVEYNGPTHVVAIVSPAEGARVPHVPGLGAPREARAWGKRKTYFFAMHDASDTRRNHTLTLYIQHSFTSPPAFWADVSLGAHAMSGGGRRARQHAALLRRLPAHVAHTGWGVDLHHYHL